MKLLQLSFMASVDSPSFTAVEEGSEHYGTVDFNLCGERDSSPLPDSLSEPPEGTTGLRDAVVDLSIDVGGMRESATQVSKVVGCLEFLSLHCDAWFMVLVAGGGLKHHFSLLGADSESKVVTGG